VTWEFHTNHPVCDYVPFLKDVVTKDIYFIDLHVIGSNAMPCCAIAIIWHLRLENPVLSTFRGEEEHRTLLRRGEPVRHVTFF
jgi:hypothetical protein